MRVRLLLLLALAVGCAFVWFRTALGAQGLAALHVLDVGQGDAVLLRSGAVDVLIDGGPDATVLARLGEVRPLWDRRLDLVVLTHPERDHLGGLVSVLERMDVGMVLLPHLSSTTRLFETFLDVLRERQITVRLARPGQRIQAGAFVLEVLAPSAESLRLSRRALNQGSVVLRAEMRGRFSTLLTGDIERAAEHVLVRDHGVRLNVDVLKVPHHGSKTSTSARLLRAVTPGLALVSVGALNRYGHPHPVVVERLRDVPLLRTDRHGTLSLVSRADGLFLYCARGCQVKAP